MHLQLCSHSEGLDFSDIISNDVMDQCLATWRGIQERKVIFDEVHGVLDMLTSMGFITNPVVDLDDVPLRVSTALKPATDEREEEKYVVELLLVPRRHWIKGKELAIGTSIKWRHQICAALGFGVVCLEATYFKQLSTEESKEYIELNTYPHGTIPQFRDLPQGKGVKEVAIDIGHQGFIQNREDKNDIWEKSDDEDPSDLDQHLPHLD